MALFKRKTDSVLPEVDKYYEGERRDRAGLAWLLALVSVAVVALVIVGVFLAGRWAYRQIADNNDDTVTISETSTENTPSFDGNTSNDDSAGTNQDTEEAPATEGEGTASEDSADGQSESDTDDNVPAATPQTGSDEELPSTGPADTLAIVAVVSTAAGLAHNIVSRKRAVR